MRRSCSIASLFQSTAGVAAVEFALTVPFLLLLCLGGFELSRFILIHYKVDKVAYTVADVVAQSTSVTTAELNQILSAAGQIMQPYSFGSDGVVLVSSVYQDGTTNPPTVRWRHTGGGSLGRSSQVGSTGGDATLPGGLTLNDRDNIIVTEVYYRYTPIFSMGIFTSSDVYKVAVFKPRLGALTTAPG